MVTSNDIKRLLYFWIASYAAAVLVYYLIWPLVPGNHVFGWVYRMPLYHYAFPLQYIALPCFFYGIIATLLAGKFRKSKLGGRILYTILIILITILISSPFGGMLWHLHDMQAGFFPENWFSKMIKNGFEDGLEAGWYIIYLSKPYNIILSILCYFITVTGAKMFQAIHPVE